MASVDPTVGVADNAVVDLSIELFAQPRSMSDDCHARIYGLRGASSLRPWKEEGVTDVAELARRDYEPDHGPAWHDEWLRHVQDVQIIVEGRIGMDWKNILTRRLSPVGQIDKAA